MFKLPLPRTSFPMVEKGRVDAWGEKEEGACQNKAPLWNEEEKANVWLG